MKATYRVKPYRKQDRPQLRAVVRWKNDDGKWECKFFSSLEEAKTFAQQREIELLNQGREALGFPSWLRLMAQECHAQLSKRGKTIRDATAYFIAHLNATESSIPIEKASADFLATKLNRANPLNPQYVARIRCQLTRLSTLFPGKLISDFTRENMETFLASLNLGALAYNTECVHLREFFNFCSKRKWCSKEKNPADDLKAERIVESEIGILTADQIAKLLESADVTTLPYVAIGAFAGLRSAELLRLDWSEVDFEDGFIEIKAKKAKSARRRLVKIQPCLRAWIAPLAKPCGLIAAEWTPYQMRKLLRRAEMDIWPHNALRHSFASYHLSQFKDAAALALEMGHTSTNLIFRHYRQVVKESQALLYWNIMPSEPENVLKFAQKNADVIRHPRHGRQPGSGRFEAHEWAKAYKHDQKYYVDYFKRGVIVIRKWMYLGMPLDDPQALADLRRGKYAHTPTQHAAIYGVSLGQIKSWRRSAWPLDNVERIKAYLDYRAKRVRLGFNGPANRSFRVVPLTAKDAREQGERLANRKSA